MPLLMTMISCLMLLLPLVEGAPVSSRVPSSIYCMDAILPSPSSTVSFQPYEPGAPSGNISISWIDVYKFMHQGILLLDAKYQLMEDDFLKITGSSPLVKLNDSNSFPYILLDYSLKYNKQEDAIELHDRTSVMLAHFSHFVCPGSGSESLGFSDLPHTDQLYCSDHATFSVSGGVGELVLSGGVQYVVGYNEVNKVIKLAFAFGRFAFSLRRVDNVTLNLVPDLVPTETIILKTPTTEEERAKCKVY
ncbi:hypothetical protein FOL47_009836 [Perkinsus chesapeaki]|uniref:Uncharacterized protein n=1 Tax=Perkinsus chesapeaki TaxID=330153 RepID=A0A7J6L6A0_PERCH|nr:hypothetical protein FOL47_009836 [Perkinsus chesapeaki]